MSDPQAQLGWFGYALKNRGPWVQWDLIEASTAMVRLFDLTRDPNEQRDLSLTSPEKARKAYEDLARLHKADDALREHYRITGEYPAAIDPEGLEQLRSLGYVH